MGEEKREVKEQRQGKGMARQRVRGRPGDRRGGKEGKEEKME